jgi:homoaconitase/3-isopropylmalate dehydratase large subunit
MSVEWGHTRGMTEVDDQTQDYHRERREVEPIGLVVLKKLRLAAYSKVKSDNVRRGKYL